MVFCVQFNNSKMQVLLFTDLDMPYSHSFRVYYEHRNVPSYRVRQHH